MKKAGGSAGHLASMDFPYRRPMGGLGQDPLTTMVALESLGYACKDNGLLFSINAHMWGCEIPLLSFGNEKQKRRYLPQLSNGELVGANAMSEPTSGSDAYSLRTTADLKGGFYILNGSKTFVTNGPVADVFLVLQRLTERKELEGLRRFLSRKIRRD